MAKPNDLDEAMSLARAYEQTLLFDKPTKTHRTSFTLCQHHPGTTSNSTTTSGTIATMIKRLSRAKMVESRSKGLCYNCNEQFSLGHRCKKLFWLEVISPEDDNEFEGDVGPIEPKISIHALIGIKNG